MFSVKLDMTKVREATKRAADVYARELATVVVDSAREGIEHAKDYKIWTSHYENPGPRLEESIKSVPGNAARWRVLRTIRTSGVKHASYIEYGTAPHAIVARRAKMLRFYWPRIGGIAYFKKVKHPGTPAFKFVGSAQSYAAARIYQRMRHIANLWGRALNR